MSYTQSKKDLKFYSDPSIPTSLDIFMATIGLGVAVKKETKPDKVYECDLGWYERGEECPF